MKAAPRSEEEAAFRSVAGDPSPPPPPPTPHLPQVERAPNNGAEGTAGPLTHASRSYPGQGTGPLPPSTFPTAPRGCAAGYVAATGAAATAGHFGEGHAPVGSGFGGAAGARTWLESGHPHSQGGRNKIGSSARGAPEGQHDQGGQAPASAEEGNRPRGSADVALSAGWKASAGGRRGATVGLDDVSMVSSCSSSDPSGGPPGQRTSADPHVWARREEAEEDAVQQRRIDDLRDMVFRLQGQIEGLAMAGVAGGLGWVFQHSEEQAPDHDEGAPAPSSPFGEHQLLGGLQTGILQEFLAKPGNRRLLQSLDPAMCPEATTTWAARLHRMAVRELYQTHSDVAQYFQHGPHARQPVTELARQLRDRELNAEDLTPLVAVRFRERLMVVCGNRRLKALKDYEEQAALPEELKVWVIVHQYPFDYLEGRLKSVLLAKFTLATSTENGGRRASFRGWRP